MSLLWMEYESAFQNLVDAAYQCEYDGRPEYFAGLSKQVQKIIYRDTRYNIDFLYTSYVLGDDKIMSDYAVWLFRLLDAVFLDKTAEETGDYVVRHFDYICEGIQQTISPERQPALIRLMGCAKKAVREAARLGAPAQLWEKDKFRYEAEIEQYMASLMEKDMKKTLQMIQQFMTKGISISDIYVEILAESMRRIGELWHTAKISVDMEHYCTSVTQLAMAQMYPFLFEKERKNRTVICACPGTELHEMGARMVADLFENDGWDSIYLGAAVPEEAMLKSIEDNHPDLVALSVTMPQHLLVCSELVEAIRDKYPDVRIAVGGKAFESTHAIWSKWKIDIYTQDARELLEQANAGFVDE